jgi:hypothetical protein
MLKSVLVSMNSPLNGLTGSPVSRAANRSGLIRGSSGVMRSGRLGVPSVPSTPVPMT